MTTTSTTREFVETSRNTGTTTRTYNYTVTDASGGQSTGSNRSSPFDFFKNKEKHIETTHSKQSVIKSVEKLNTFTKFQVESLTEHNVHRKKHGAPDLRLSKEICEYAQEWANVSIFQCF